MPRRGLESETGHAGSTPRVSWTVGSTTEEAGSGTCKGMACVWKVVADEGSEGWCAGVRAKGDASPPLVTTLGASESSRPAAGGRRDGRSEVVPGKTNANMAWQTLGSRGQPMAARTGVAGSMTHRRPARGAADSWAGLGGLC